MRYFKYKNTSKNFNNALKEQYKLLTEDEKSIVRKEKRVRKLCKIVTVAVYILCIVIGIFFIGAFPRPEGLLWRILLMIGKVLVGIIWIMISGILTVGLTMPLWKKLEAYHIPSIKKELFSKACGHLREYYRLQEPYIITKCFDVADKRFRDHDVCIFLVGDELRITTDLVRGFLHGERDLGCYAFSRKEITVSKQQDGEHLVAELKSDNTFFVLGYRAKGFIEKNFLFE